MTVESPDFLLSRRKLLKRLSVSVAACGLGLASRPTVVSAAEVDWLAEVTTPPKDVPRPDNLGRLDPLLVDSSGRAIRTLEAWKVHRKSLRATWLKFLGPMPTKRPPVELKTLRVDNELGFTRTLVRYESEAGVPVEGYLLRPAKSSTDKQQVRPALCARIPLAGTEALSSRVHRLLPAELSMAVGRELHGCRRAVPETTSENTRHAQDALRCDARR
jgi:hypothetical protein